MSRRVDQLIDQIKELSPDELTELETAFEEKRWTDDDWDRQMRADFASGKFDEWIAEVDADAAAGHTEECK